MKQDLRNIGILLTIVLLLSFTNFTPNTFLTGWDNLHPEFNFGLNAFRAVFSSWQEYQGLGLAGGMGHAADLPRQLVLWLISFVLPIQLLRYVYHFSTILIGTIGAYFLLRKSVFMHHSAGARSSLIGAIFYLCNLATLQMFYVPFEPFSHHFAALPWILFGNTKYLANPTKKTLGLLIFITFLAIPQGFVATYFLVTGMLLGLMYIIHIVKTKTVKSVAVAVIVLFCVNAFWLLPNMYFLLFKSNVNVNAKINEMATEENFLKNKKYGDLKNSVILKNFWFDNVETNPDGTITYQMQEWIPHFNNPVILGIGYLLFLAVLGGIVTAIKHKSPALLYLPLLFIAFTLLANDAPLFSSLAKLFYKVPLFSQIFRFPFTKFAIVTSLCFGIFYAVFCHLLFRKGKWTRVLFVLFAALPILFMYPMFFGKFFQEKNKIVIPQSYFDTFAFFEKQNKTDRVGNFPQYTYWGWSLYRWGYRGSGILWYGMEQPIVDRAFDVWGRENENYYHEVSYAVYSGNQELFENVLDKYDITWLLIDNDIISFSSQKPIYFNKLREIVNNSPNIKKAATFDSVNIYRIERDSTPETYISLQENAPVIGPTYAWNNYDSAYEDFGNYIHDPKRQFDAYYPFRSLFSNKEQDKREFHVADKGSYFSFTARVPKTLVGKSLLLPLVLGNFSEVLEEETEEKLPQIYLDNELIPYDLPKGSAQEIATLSGHIEITLPYIREGKLEIRIPKIEGAYSFDSDKLSLSSLTPTACNPFTVGLHEYRVVEAQNGKSLLELKSNNSSNCVDFELPGLLHRLGYFVSVESIYKQGKSLLFIVRNKNSFREEIEVYLPKNKELTTSYFVIPPMERFTAGYTLHFDNIATGRATTINSVGRVTMYPIPYNLLSKIKIVSDTEKELLNPRTDVFTSISHPNPSLYIVQHKELPKNSTLLLSQGFDRGWQAYRLNFKCQISNVKCTLAGAFPFFFGERLKNHVLVNNWANGWILPKETMEQSNNRTITIVFLPQYLQYIGAVFFIIPFIFLLAFHRKHH